MVRFKADGHHRFAFPQLLRPACRIRHLERSCRWLRNKTMRRRKTTLDEHTKVFRWTGTIAHPGHPPPQKNHHAHFSPQISCTILFFLRTKGKRTRVDHMRFMHRPLSKNKKNVVVYHLDCNARITRRNPRKRQTNICLKTDHM